MSTLYASFISARDAEQAAGALIDQGARAEDISFLAGEDYASTRTQSQLIHEEKAAKEGISTTTGADAAAGAVKGLTIGTGLGIVGAFAALAVPGIGIVFGAGALAVALSAGVATAAAGAAVGGVVGYLRDQGMSETQITHYDEAVRGGGAILTLTLPTGSIEEDQAEGILVKYGSTNVATINPGVNEVAPTHHIPDAFDFPTTTARIAPPGVPEQPLLINDLLPNEGGYDPDSSGFLATIPVSDVTPTKIDPVSGLIQEGIVFDSTTGAERRVRSENGRFVYVI